MPDAAKERPQEATRDLTEEQKKQIRKWLWEKCRGLECPACHQTDFGLGTVALAVPELGMPSLANCRVLPCCSAHCKYCGYTMFFSLTKMEILQPDGEEDATAPPAGALKEGGANDG